MLRSRVGTGGCRVYRVVKCWTGRRIDTQTVRSTRPVPPVRSLFTEAVPVAGRNVIKDRDGKAVTAVEKVEFSSGSMARETGRFGRGGILAER